ncbi:MAG: 5-(carboxyamino)imidazole ribonucleotide mutase [Firmicutes bacterium]|nr:5-(carboxyamino)imidazole ribonucleotide mutase [Bacillota bacterium]
MEQTSGQAKQPLVSIIMGSASDLSLMSEAAETLETFEVGFEMFIASAHRTPDKVREIAGGAEARGVRVIIAGAGLSAHLPGVIAAHTTLPVIGVPLKSGALNGVDALYSIVQMPPGVPVAAVGVDSARNAALLALQILASGDGAASERLRARMRDYREKMASGVLSKDAELQHKGYKGMTGKA